MANVTDDDVDAMVDAAFKELAERHPECTSGDMDFGVINAVKAILLQAATHWVECNTPSKEA